MEDIAEVCQNLEYGGRISMTDGVRRVVAGDKVHYTIAGAMIVFNEEWNIREALDSVAWVDEIVVVDSYSTNETVRICHESIPHVFQRVWKGSARYDNVAVHEYLLGDGKVGTLTGHRDHHTERQIQDHFKKFPLYATLPRRRRARWFGKCSVLT